MNLFIRNFPDQIHKALKIKAAQLEISLSSLIIQTLEEIVDESKSNKGLVKKGGQN
jgi:plasmid stability protein